MNARRVVPSLTVLASVAVAVVVLGVPAVASAPAFTTIATGLDNPRGMGFGPNGALYVAEAGEGGSDFCFAHPEFGLECGGATGAVTRIWKGRQERVVEGLPSTAPPSGNEAGGPADVVVHGNGNMFIPIGFG